MIIEGQRATHGGWSFESQVRNFELEVAVFENIRNQPIELGDFEYSELAADDLRYAEETDAALATAPRRRRPLETSRTLLSGEKLVIPLRIHFTFMRPLEVLEGSPRHVLQQRISRATEGRIQFFDYRNEPLMSKDPESLVLDEPPRFVKRIDFGPAWSLQRVVIDGHPHTIREPDWENFAVFLSTEKGSCPYVFTLQPETGVWLNEGHVLLGATAPDLARRDTIDLRHFNGRVQLRELAAEVAVIRQATLEIVDQHGSTRTLQPTNASIKRGHGMLLEKGEAMELVFPVTYGIRDTARLTVEGYYIPYSSANLVRRQGKALIN
ncbi:MAG: hypothetical protein MN733_11680 [Nitrososphaera sp.]|nr:hypothetical protein [Nitrososphaera sp.]